MKNRAKIMPSFKELKEDMKDMTFGEKVDHLWTYYKIYLFLALVAIFMIVMVVNIAINASKKIVVSGMLANVEMTQEGYDYLTIDYFDVLGCKEGKERVELQSTNFSSLEDPTSSEDNSTSAQKLILQVASGDMDYAIVDRFAIEFYVKEDVFSDLRDVFPADVIAELAENDMLYYMVAVSNDANLNDIENVEVDMANRIPIGIKMQTLPFTQEAMHGGDYYFCATSHDPDPEVIVGVWEYILNWENR